MSSSGLYKKQRAKAIEVFYGSFKQWVSTESAKNPKRVVLIGIIFLNLIFITVAALVISCPEPASS